MKYCCEVCRKMFDTEEKALACEKVHKIEEEKKQKLWEEKSQRLAAIKKARRELLNMENKYASDYNDRIPASYRSPLDTLLNFLEDCNEKDLCN